MNTGISACAVRANASVPFANITALEDAGMITERYKYPADVVDLELINQSLNKVFPDYNTVLALINNLGQTYITTKNCYLCGTLTQTSCTSGATLFIGGTTLATTSANLLVKKGDIIKTRADSGTYNLKVYALAK